MGEKSSPKVYLQETKYALLTGRGAKNAWKTTRNLQITPVPVSVHVPVPVPVPVLILVVDPATLPRRSTCESYLWEEPTTSSSYSKHLLFLYLDKVEDHPIELNLELNTVLVEFPTQHRSTGSSRSANQKTAITQNLCRIWPFLRRPKYEVLTFVQNDRFGGGMMCSQNFFDVWKISTCFAAADLLLGLICEQWKLLQSSSNSPPDLRKNPSSLTSCFDTN